MYLGGGAKRGLKRLLKGVTLTASGVVHLQKQAPYATCHTEIFAAMQRATVTATQTHPPRSTSAYMSTCRPDEPPPPPTHLVEVDDLKQGPLEEAAGHNQVQQTLVQQVLSSLWHGGGVGGSGSSSSSGVMTQSQQQGRYSTACWTPHSPEHSHNMLDPHTVFLIASCRVAVTGAVVQPCHKRWARSYVYSMFNTLLQHTAASHQPRHPSAAHTV